MLETYIVVAIGAVAAGLVQGLSGFGFGLTAMSFWAWSLEPRLAASLAVFGALMGQIIAAINVRRTFSWKTLLPFIAGGLAGLPIGVLLLPQIDMVVFKTILGTLLIVWCPLMLASKRLPQIAFGGWMADGGAGLAGGIMGGLGGFTGVLPTLWCTLRGYDRDLQRSVIQNFNLAMLLATMAAYVGSGIATGDMLPMFLIVAPALIIPTIIGSRVYIGLSDAKFRQIVLALLTLSGVAMLVSALPHYFR